MTRVFFILVGCTFFAQSAAAQSTITFQNRMNSAADVTITEVGTTNVATLALGGEQAPVKFSFSGQRFDIQVVPRDRPDTGFRLSNVDLARLAVLAQGRPVELGGELAGAVKQCHWYRKHLRWHCCCQMVQSGERVAVTLDVDLSDGTHFHERGPKMSY
jgi:hypothetical protein